MSDFNVVLRAHETYSRHMPKNTSCDEFRTWSDSNDLIHLDTI